MGRLPHVLLGIRTAQRSDAGFSPAEWVYGTNLVLPGQLQTSAELPTSLQPLQDYTVRLKADMSTARCPEPAWHTATTRAPIPVALREADHMFVRHGAGPAPLTRPYDSPFRVLQRGEKFFTVKVGTKEQVITVDRLKPAFGFADPAFGFADPAPAVLKPQVKKTSTRIKIPRTKRTLDPTAEVFVPTTTVSRAGRIIKPPVRLDL